MTYSRSAIIRGTHCGTLCPESLSGPLGPVKCSLETNGEGLHDGDHRAHVTVHRVGKAKFSWRNKNKPSRQPPVIVLPVPTASHVQPNRAGLV